MYVALSLMILLLQVVAFSSVFRRSTSSPMRFLPMPVEISLVDVDTDECVAVGKLFASELLSELTLSATTTVSLKPLNDGQSPVTLSLEVSMTRDAGDDKAFPGVLTAGKLGQIPFELCVEHCTLQPKQ